MNLIPQVNAAAVTTPSIPVQTGSGYFTSFPEMITSILTIVLTLATIMVLFYLIWGGIDWLTSGGDKGKTESARNKITAALIGLIIIISSWAILIFVQQLLNINVFK